MLSVAIALQEGNIFYTLTGGKTLLQKLSQINNELNQAAKE